MYLVYTSKLGILGLHQHEYMSSQKKKIAGKWCGTTMQGSYLGELQQKQRQRRARAEDTSARWQPRDVQHLLFAAAVFVAS